MGTVALRLFWVVQGPVESSSRGHTIVFRTSALHISNSPSGTENADWRKQSLANVEKLLSTKGRLNELAFPLNSSQQPFKNATEPTVFLSYHSAHSLSPRDLPCLPLEVTSNIGFQKSWAQAQTSIFMGFSVCFKCCKVTNQDKDSNQNRRKRAVIVIYPFIRPNFGIHCCANTNHLNT